MLVGPKCSEFPARLTTNGHSRTGCLLSCCHRGGRDQDGSAEVDSATALAQYTKIPARPATIVSRSAFFKARAIQSPNKKKQTYQVEVNKTTNNQLQQDKSQKSNQLAPVFDFNFFSLLRSDCWCCCCCCCCVC